MNNAVATNETKQKLARGETVLGAFFASYVPSPAAVEILGYAGLDFCVFDAEHAPMDLGTLEHLVRAAEVSGTTPLVRTPGLTNRDILPLLDTGVWGIQIPHVRGVEDVREALRAAKFHPIGQRGFTSRSRAARYGLGIAAADLPEAANAQTMIVVQLEELDAARNLRELCELEEIDVFFLAPGDLSQSLGVPGKYDDPAVRKVIDEMVEVLHQEGRVIGTIVSDPAGIEAAVELGARYIVIRAAAILSSGVTQMRAALSGAQDGNHRD